MKTKAVPAMIMLTAGLIDCILSIYCRLSLWRFTWQLLVVLIIFYFLGCIVQLILDKNFAKIEDETTKPQADDASAEAAEADEMPEEPEQIHAGEKDE